MRSTLFTPLVLRNVTIPNRIFVSPMCQYSAVEGVPNQWHLVHYGSRAVGGAGLVIAEATAVAPEGRITRGDCGLWDDCQVEPWARIAALVAAQGAVPGIQLGHAGRKASCHVPWEGGAPVPAGEGGWQTVAPSALGFAETDPVPRELSESEIEALPGVFAAAARRAVAAGFEVVELHMAHGYLLHQFLSPISNRRQDQWGGPTAHRVRLPLAVARAVREAVGDERLLFVRVSSSDWVEGGWDLDQTIAFAHELKALGVDLVDCSAGGAVPKAPMRTGPGFMTPFATAVRNHVGIATATVGFITQPAQAEQIVATGLADAVLLGRELLRDPYWPLHAARELGCEVRWPDQYLRARR